MIFAIFISATSFMLSVSATDVAISSNANTTSIVARKGIISKVLHAKPMDFTYRALAIFIDATLIEPRGRMQGRLISLSAGVSRDSEFLKLFVHELGHYIDIYVLTSIDRVDTSSNFYAISWKSTNVKRSTESISSFVTGYALTNQYEDFAESLVFYIFHNRIFEDRAMRNDSIRQKYLFFQKYLFPS